MSISEPDLILAEERILYIPALIMFNEFGEMSTSELIQLLTDAFEPIGHDSEILSGRNDTYFSQKVRNISRSRKELEEYVDYSRNHWKIKGEGIKFLDDNSDLIEEVKIILFDTSFSYSDKLTVIERAIRHLFPKKTGRRKIDKTPLPTNSNNKIMVFDETVSEGKEFVKSVKVRERSRKLRDKAVQYYTVNGKISCDICGFDFHDNYGELGKGYIEIHHKKPVYMIESDDQEKVMSEALKNLAPVCPNCHRMLHRRKNISYEEVVEAFKKSKNN